MIVDSSSRESKQILVHREVTCTGRDDRHAQSGPRKISIDMVFVKWVQSEIYRFQDIPFVCLHTHSAE
jgi:hypothetical protein